MAVERDAAAEFGDRLPAGDAIRERWGELEARLTETLAALTVSALEAEVSHPRQGRLSGFEVLIVAVRHAAEHMGQAELTRDLVIARRSSTTAR